VTNLFAPSQGTRASGRHATMMRVSSRGREHEAFNASTLGRTTPGEPRVLPDLQQARTPQPPSASKPGSASRRPRPLSSSGSPKPTHRPTTPSVRAVRLASLQHRPRSAGTPPSQCDLAGIDVIRPVQQLCTEGKKLSVEGSCFGENHSCIEAEATADSNLEAENGGTTSALRSEAPNTIHAGNASEDRPMPQSLADLICEKTINLIQVCLLIVRMFAQCVNAEFVILPNAHT
jgi:hypothetical protein